MLSSETFLRIHCFDLRVRLENLAENAFSLVCEPHSRQPNSNTRAKLLFALHEVENSKFHEVHGLIQYSAYIYRATSDVLHGRSSMVNLSAVLVEEWQSTVTSLESQLAKLPAGQRQIN